MPHTLLLLALFLPGFPDQFTGKVVAITDGDSITVLREKEEVVVRLEGIDCPEMGQDFGTKAKEQAARLAFGKTVTVQPTGKDNYGRTLANVLLPDGTHLNQELVRSGYAWWFRKYSKDKTLEKLEADAREKKLGLWSQPNPMAPWDWRALKKPKQPAPATAVVPIGVDIVALLPNPEGKDEGQEMVGLHNATDKEVKLDGWKFRDRAGNEFRLVGTIGPAKRMDIRLEPPSMPLNNDGDDVSLIDANGVVRSRVSYTKDEVRSGKWIKWASPPK